MVTDNTAWNYNEFLAFLMVYGAGMNYELSNDELNFIKIRTGIDDIEKIKKQVDGMKDVEAIDLIDAYKQKYLPSTDAKIKVRKDLDELLKAPGMHSQLETVAVHLIERFI
jgi:hypothetical protein